MNTTRPPRWAEALLRAILPPRDEETVSGDLLEECRERALPERGQPGCRPLVPQTLPILLVVPAVVLGTLGGLCGRVSRRIVAPSSIGPA
jgi:hypothetical protein